MTTTWLAVGLGAWVVASLIVGLMFGRAIRLADRRATERYDELDADLTKVEESLDKLTAARSATRVMSVVRPLPQTAAPTPSTGKHAQCD